MLHVYESSNSHIKYSAEEEEWREDLDELDLDGDEHTYVEVFVDDVLHAQSQAHEVGHPDDHLLCGVYRVQSVLHLDPCVLVR